MLNNKIMTDTEKQIKKFIGDKAVYDPYGGTYIWGVNKKVEQQMLADIDCPTKDELKALNDGVVRLRGWGAIQHMFKNMKDAEKFQDDLGKFVAEAINEKLERLK